MVGLGAGCLVLGETLRPGDAGWVRLVAADRGDGGAAAALARGEAAAATRSLMG